MRTLRCALSLTVLLSGIAAWCGEHAVREPWMPEPAGKDSPIEAVRVRIVDFGTDFLHDGDGRPPHQFGVHRYRLRKDASTGLWNAVKDLQQDLTVDVDRDGRTDDDVVAFYPFSLERPFSPVAPWYDRLAGTPRWYGGAAILQANARQSGFSESGVNHGHDGPCHYPRDNWALFHESYEVYSPYRLCGLWLWQKRDFLNGGAEFPVRLDERTELALYVQRYFMGVSGVRFVVRDGEQFYMSEAVFRGAGQERSVGNGKQHVLCPPKTRWAPYQPKPPHAIGFDAESASFAAHRFENVTAVGMYACKDKFTPGYFGFKWYAFEADAVVERRSRPSEHVAMVKVDGNRELPPFYASTCEVPYLLWKNVSRLARSNTFVRDPRGFTFDKDGDMGSMDYGSTAHAPQPAFRG